MNLLEIIVERSCRETVMVFVFNGFTLKEVVNDYWDNSEIEDRGVLATTIIGLN